MAGDARAGRRRAALGSAQAELYAAEDEAIDRLGIHWSRLADAQRYVDELLGSGWFGERWPHFLRCVVERRGRGSTWSCCHPLDRAGAGGRPTEGVILIADGGLRQPVVLHELAHLLSPRDAGHGVPFAETQLALVRREMGFFAFADYFHALRRRPPFGALREPAA